MGEVPTEVKIGGVTAQVVHGLIKMYLMEEEARDCQEPRCNRDIPPLSVFFLCVLSNKVYCAICGPPIRYHRRKAEERGETITADTGIDE